MKFHQKVEAYTALGGVAGYGLVCYIASPYVEAFHAAHPESTQNAFDYGRAHWTNWNPATPEDHLAVDVELLLLCTMISIMSTAIMLGTMHDDWVAKRAQAKGQGAA